MSGRFIRVGSLKNNKEKVKEINSNSKKLIIDNIINMCEECVTYK